MCHHVLSLVLCPSSTHNLILNHLSARRPLFSIARVGLRVVDTQSPIRAINEYEFATARFNACVLVPIVVMGARSPVFSVTTTARARAAVVVLGRIFSLAVSVSADEHAQSAK